MSKDELLDTRLCDLSKLGVSIRRSLLAERIEQIYAELDARGLSFRPHFWLSTEWFTPDGVPGIAIPFYLAHPRLQKLEEKQMLEAEGGTRKWCMQILRHEVGHAIDNAYRLHRKRAWQSTFGRYSDPYPEYYQPRPYSKRYVLHLSSWYAQSHPSEDWAETFAVWLTPGAQWRKQYDGWPAIRKLECVDELMRNIAGRRPAVSNQRRMDTLRGNRMTLREYYTEKRLVYGTEYPEIYDRDLRRLFPESPDRRRGTAAAAFLRRIRSEIRPVVARWTGEYQYIIEHVLDELIVRCRELKLRVTRPHNRVRLEATILLTIQTINHLHAGHSRLAL